MVLGMRIDEAIVASALGTVLDYYNVSLGRGYEAPIRCPSHDDSHASASANISKGVWHCHACGAGGNALHVIMAKELCTLDEAYILLQKLVEGQDIAPVHTVTIRKKSKGGRSKWTPPRLRA